MKLSDGIGIGIAQPLALAVDYASVAVVAEIMESPKVARSLYVYKSQLATHRQIIKHFSLLESSELKSWHNLTEAYIACASPVRQKL